MNVPVNSFVRYTAHGHNTSPVVDGPYEYSWEFSDGVITTEPIYIKHWPVVGSYVATIRCDNLSTGESLEQIINVKVYNIISSEFTLGLDGWVAVADGTVSVEDGLLKLVDKALGQITFFGAPAKYLGDKLSYYNGKINYTIKVNYFTNVFPEGAIQLIGGGLTLVADLPNGSLVPGVFTNVEYNLNTTTPWKLNTMSGALATEAQIQTVLANLTNLNICGEFSDNTDTSYLSTVSLTES